jgi:TolA-binding protein
MQTNYRRLLRSSIWIALISLTVASACNRKRTPVAALPPSPAPVVVAAPEPVPAPRDREPPAPVVVTPAPAPAPEAIAFDSADRAFASREYGVAIRSFEEYLRLAPAGEKRDEALFHLGLVYGLPDYAGRDWQKASTYLRQLVTEFPDSPRRASADLILALRNEVTQLTSDAEKQNQRIRQLTTELERLKQIDADRRKRP